MRPETRCSDWCLFLVRVISHCQCACLAQCFLQNSSPRYRHSVHAAESDWPGSRRHWRCGPMASSGPSLNRSSRPIIRWHPCQYPMHISLWMSLRMSLYGANAGISIGILSFCREWTFENTAEWQYPYENPLECPYIKLYKDICGDMPYDIQFQCQGCPWFSGISFWEWTVVFLAKVQIP